MRAARDSKNVKTVPIEPAQGRIPKEWASSASSPAKPRGFPQVPTHAVGAPYERRLYPRAALRLPLRLKRVAGQREQSPVRLITKNISSSGVYFLCPMWIDPGTPIELEVGLVERPLGRGSVRMTTLAHVVRSEATETPGWHGLAASFDDISFQRDEPIPPRIRKP
jgi:hypothetical protein